MASLIIHLTITKNISFEKNQSTQQSVLFICNRCYSKIYVIIFIIINFFLISKFTLFAFAFFSRKYYFTYMICLYVLFTNNFNLFFSFIFFLYMTAILSTQLKNSRFVVVVVWLIDERKMNNRMKCLIFCFELSLLQNL